MQPSFRACIRYRRRLALRLIALFLCCVWLLCVLFVLVCRLALRLAALCVVRCGLLSCVDLCVALRGGRDGS